MFTISKDFAFSASHQLRGLAVDHPCSRLHGHNYLVRLTLARDDLDATGFVIDYGDLSPFQAMIDTLLDHRHLNHVLPFNPTAEHLARHLFDWCLDQGWPVTAVAVSETPKTWASYGH